MGEYENKQNVTDHGWIVIWPRKGSKVAPVTWMNLECDRLSEINQMHKEKSCMYQLEGLSGGRAIEAEMRIVVSGGWREDKWGAGI